MLFDSKKELKMKEEEIRAPELLEEHGKLYLKDMASLASKIKDFMKITCPACNSDEYCKEFDKFGFNFDRCKKCNTLFVNPRASVETLHNYYNTSKYYRFWADKLFPASEEARRKKIFAPRVDNIIELCGLNNNSMNCLIEVGAGFGTFCQELKSRNLFKRIIAIELVPDLADKCRERGIEEVIESGIEDVSLEEECADVIVSFEVIEHLFSPYDFLMKSHEILKPGGLLVLTCPNVSGFDLSILREKTHTFDGEHINYFNPYSLDLLLKRCEFDVLEAKTPGKLDAEIVRKKILNKEYDVSQQPFLKEVLVDRWEEIGSNFQEFLADNMLSSHMWIVGEKRTKTDS